MTNFGLVDFMGFAKIMKVDDELIKEAFTFAAIGDDKDSKAIENLVCKIVENYQDLGRKERREILKLAKTISAANIEEKKNNSSPQE